MALRAGPTLRHRDHVAHDLRELIDLEHRQRAEQRRDAEERRERPPSPAEALADHVHRTALEMAVAVIAAIEDAGRAGEELGGDAEDGGDPHPEHRAGSAGVDRHGHAGDVAEADRGRERARQRLEVRDVAVVVGVVVATGEQREPVREVPVGQELRVEQEERARAEQEIKDERAPHEVGERGQPRVEQLEHRSGVLPLPEPVQGASPRGGGRASAPRRAWPRRSIRARIRPFDRNA